MDIVVKKFNEVYVKVFTNKGIEVEIQEQFSFFAQNYKFQPKFKAGIWNGKINLYNRASKALYKGLLTRLVAFADERGYTIDVGDQLYSEDIDVSEIKSFLKEIKTKYEPRDYQLDAIKHCLDNVRATAISPTASGKSFIIYSLIRWLNCRTLLIVPRIALTNQMEGDFIDYTKDDWDCSQNIGKIYGGQDKNKKNQVIITTWQSIHDLPRSWFDQFECVICDEVHEAKSTSIRGIMEKLENCPFRFGFTGTLDGIDANEQTIEGCFGPIKKIVSTAELMEQGHVADIHINAYVLEYSKESKKSILVHDPEKKTYKRDYQVEKEFITGHVRRNMFIVKLALSLKGNTLVLFKEIETHGDVLLELAKKHKPIDTNIFYTTGETKVDERELIRIEMNKRGINQVYFASLGTTSTGINIQNIDNIIFAAPSKSRIKVLQSIGRGLRKSETKTKMTLYDIADNLAISKSNVNYTYNHFIERLKMYTTEQFPYTIKMIPLEN